MVRTLFFASLATLMMVTLAGCDSARYALMPAAEKVNAAFPLPEELVVAQNQLFASVPDEKAASTMKAQHARLMELRGLTCSSSARIGRFDSPVDVKKQITDVKCFRAQDTLLADWVGLRRFVAAVRMPASVPLGPLAPRAVVPPQIEPPAAVIAARDANIAVIQGNRGSYTTVQLPSGKAVQSFSPGAALRLPTLSPNGRVLALPMSNSVLKMVDTETGNALWNTTAYTEVISWLPEIDATVLAEKGKSSPVLLNHQTGNAEPYAVGIAIPTWSVAAPGTNARHLVGDINTAVSVEHTRNADGSIAVTTGARWRLTGDGVTSAAPMVMKGGKKLVYLSVRDLAWLDMETGEQGVWPVASINARGFAKTSDNGIYFDANSPAAGHEAMLFNIDTATVTRVQGADVNEGLLMPLGPRQGYVRRGFLTAVLGSDPKAEGEAMPIDKMVAETLLAQQFKKLETFSSGGQPGAWNTPATQIIRTLPSGERIVTPGLMAGGGINTVQGIPPDAQLSAIGVYESEGRRGPVKVNIAPGKTPLILSLSSYEPVEWVIRNQGRPVSAILLSGYGRSRVVGYSGTTIVIGSQYAYEIGSPQFMELKMQISRYVQQPIRLFQGVYGGSEFTVPNN